MSSRYEPFGMVAIEAMACGTPAVITVHGGLFELVNFGKQALYAVPIALLSSVQCWHFRCCILTWGINSPLKERVLPDATSAGQASLKKAWPSSIPLRSAAPVKPFNSFLPPLTLHLPDSLQYASSVKTQRAKGGACLRLANFQN